MLPQLEDLQGVVVRFGGYLPLGTDLEGGAGGASGRPDARADRGALVHGGGVRASGGARVEHFLLSRPLMDTLRRGGLSVTTGTLNEPALVDRGVPSLAA